MCSCPDTDIDLNNLLGTVEPPTSGHNRDQKGCLYVGGMISKCLVIGGSHLR